MDKHGGGPHKSRKKGLGRPKWQIRQAANAAAGHGDDSDRDDRRTRWKFGQNFLVDETLVRNICEDVPCALGDWLIEIGPGQGALTRRLGPRVKRLTAIEIDAHWADKLKGKSEWGDIEVIQTDATTINVETLLGEHAPEGFDKKTRKPYLVGNLPYNRAAPILFHFLPFIGRFHSWQVMLQYEVAKRVCAKPGTRDFGAMTVAIGNYATCEILRKIEPDAFRPRPKVWSATVRITPRANAICEDVEFGRFVDLCFSQKRKKLTNVLEAFYGKEKVMAALLAGGFNTDVRAEVIGVAAFAALFAELGRVKVR